MAMPVEALYQGPVQERRKKFKHLDLTFDCGPGVLWKYISENSTRYFCTEQLNEIRYVQTAVAEGKPLNVANYDPGNVRYLVFGSKAPGVFSLGGDLQLFREYIFNRDRRGLEAYAKIATDAVYDHGTNARNITTFSLVQGTALGGGFEAALAGNVVVAERGTRMGFPEVLFGLFPGMGAYTLLRRRVSHAVAEKIILSAQNYAAEDLHEMGVIDLLVDPGQGERAINSYISRTQNRPGVSAFRKALNRTRVIDHKELYTISDEWVTAAMELPECHLRRFDRLIKKQKALDAKQSSASPTIRATTTSRYR